MQKRLRLTFFFAAFSLSLFLFPERGYELYAQIKLSTDQSQLVRFATEDSNQSEGIVLLLGQDQEYSTLRWLEFSPDSNLSDDESFYLSSEGGFVSPGRVQHSLTEEATFVTLELINDAGFGFGGLDAAFDFIYSAETEIANHTLLLRYSVNDGAWRTLPVSRISTSTFTSTASESEWNSFSTQIGIQDIYLRKGDQIRLQWIFESATADEVERDLPLFIQRIDLNPVKHEAAGLDRGAFIVTEIFPSFQVDREPFEYVEIFNPSDEPIFLKGTEMVTSRGRLVIEREAEIPPYSLMVLSNRDISELSGVGAFYLYEGNFISDEGGRIDFYRGDKLIAGTLYSADDPGRSHELQRAVLSEGTGYSALQNLEPSSERIAGDLYGSPGSFGSTVPFYRKTLRKSGWYLISPPGTLPGRFNFHSELEWFTLNGESIRPERIRPNQPVAIYKSDSTPITIIAEGTDAGNGLDGLSHSGYRDSFGIVSLTEPDRANIKQIADSRSRQLAPMLLVWDSTAERFTFLDSFHSEIPGWSPIIYNRNSHDGSALSLTTGSVQPVEIAERLNLRLFTGSDNNRLLQDEVVIGFTDHQRFQNERFDLPVIDGTFVRDASFPGRDALYLTLPEATYSANTFVHVPAELTSVKQIGIGFDPRPGTSGQASLSWTLPDELSESVTFILEDLSTGITVHMNDENSFRFRYSTEPKEAGAETAVRGVHSRTPSLANRFILKMEPAGVELSEAAEELRTGSVELHPNYPNPFNPATTISFSLPEERSVRLGVYNIVGQQVTLLIDESLRPGIHTVVWDGTSAPSGIYIVQLETGGRILTRKMALIK